MSNQRSGKIQNGSDQIGSEMGVFKFFKEAKIQLEEAGESDVHFILNKCKIGLVVVKNFLLTKTQ